jgi:BioD-like phosphotransacetylase family protein
LKIFRHTVGRILLIEPEDKCTTQDAGELRESLAGILLTGQRLPSPALIEAAREAGIALLHCPQDRFAVLDRLQQTLVSVRLEERYKKERFQELILRDLGIAHILACSCAKDSLGGG